MWLSSLLAALLALVVCGSAQAQYHPPSGGGSGAPLTPQYLTLDLDSRLVNSRQLVFSSPLSVSDAGALGTYTITCSTCAAGAPTTATYITQSANGTLTAERVLTAGTGITLTDGGANSTMTIGFNSTIIATVSSAQTLASKTFTSPTAFTYVNNLGLQLLNSSSGTAAIIKWEDAGTGRTYNIADMGANGDFVVTSGTQTLTGYKTFDGLQLTAQTFYLNGSHATNANTVSVPAGVGGNVATLVSTEATQTLTGKSIAVGQLTGTLATTNGGTGIATYTAGDVLTVNDAGTLVKLGGGTNNDVLTYDSTGNPNVKWAAPAGGGTQTFVTTADETGTLPNSVRLSTVAVDFGTAQTGISGTKEFTDFITCTAGFISPSYKITDSGNSLNFVFGPTGTLGQSVTVSVPDVGQNTATVMLTQDAAPTPGGIPFYAASGFGFVTASPAGGNGQFFIFNSTPGWGNTVSAAGGADAAIIARADGSQSYDIFRVEEPAHKVLWGIDKIGNVIMNCGGSADTGVKSTTLTVDTTNGTATNLLKSDGSSFACASGRTYSCVVNICARKDDGTSKQFLRQFVIKNTGGTTAIAGTVAILGTDSGDAGATTWSVAITADNTNDVLQIAVTGAAATNIRWLCRLETTEVSY